MSAVARKTWWASVGLHVAALLLLRQLPVQAREAKEPETIELVAPPEPPPPKPEPKPPEPKPPEPEAKPEPEPEPEPAKTPPPPPKADKPQPKLRAAVPTVAGPGSADAPAIAGDFSNEPPPAPVAPSAPAAPAAPKAVEKEEPKCTEALVKAKPIEPAQPVMTDAMREAGLAGKVRIELKIDAQGNVTSAKVLEGLGSGFDEAALAAARATTFTPATKCGEAVASTFVMSIRFTL